MVAGIRPEDFCYLQAVLAADGEVTHYVLTGTVPTKTVDSAVIAPRTVYPLATRPVPGDDAYLPIDTVTVTGTGQNQVISASRRLSMPSKWASVGSWGTFSWLRNHGNGQQLGPNEDYREKQGTNSTTEVVHNPTFGGGLSQFTDFLMPEAGLGLRFSPPVEGVWEATGGAATAGVARIRGAVYPMHWSPDGTGQSSGSTDPANWDHGGELGVTDVLFWDQRQLFDIKPAYLGDEAVHRLSLWSFQREGWTPANAAGAQPFFGTLNFGAYITDEFDVAEILDLQNGTSFPATAFLVNMSVGVSMDIRTTWMRIESFPGGSQGFATPVPSGYAAILLHNTNVDFCIAMASRIFDDSDGCRRPSLMRLWTYRDGPVPYPGTVTTPDESLYGPGLVIAADGASRTAGWCAISSFLVTGTYAQVQAKLAEIYSSGLLDTVIPSDLPAEVLDGTAAVPDYYLPETPTPTPAAATDTSPAAAIAAIDAALARGIDVASYVVDGQQVTLRSPAEMLEVRRLLLIDQARSSGARRTRLSL